MRAAVWHNRRDVRIEEVDNPPAPPEHQVQVKVSWCGICGTDLFRRLKGFRRIFSRFEKLDVVFRAFLNFALIVEALRLV